MTSELTSKNNLNIIGTIPYFGRHDQYQQRILNWVHVTIDSIQDICEKIYIHVCNDIDYNDLEKYKNNEQFEIIYHKDLNKTTYLPAYSQRYIQSLKLKNKYILYTEADQIFHIHNLQQLLNQLDNKYYIAPHRCIQLTDKDILGKWPFFGHAYNYDHKRKLHHYRWLYERFFDNNKEYVLGNKRPGCDSNIINKYFYSNNDKGLAYGAAFLSTSQLFNRVHFRNGMLEDASGFDIFRISTCLKTMNNQHFWIDHLSHRTGEHI